MDHSNPNLRRIAILVSSIDTSAAEQLLAQLPEEVCQDVCEAAKALTDVSPCEREEVLREFQNEISSICCVSADDCAATPQLNRIHDKRSEEIGDEGVRTQWSRLPTDSIVAAVANEQPILVAVLVSQIDAYGASDLLSKLPSSQSCEVLRALKSLHELAADQRQLIEARLSHLFSEAEVRSRRGQQYDRQLSALVEAAPEELQQVWRTAIANSHDDLSATEQSDRNLFNQFDASLRAFQGPQNVALLELEDLLDLPRDLLAELFSTTAPETVLLSLAGASSEFMDSLTSMLIREDAKALQERLLRLGAIQISDIDQAQAYLLKNARILLTRAQAA